MNEFDSLLPDRIHDLEPLGRMSVFRSRGKAAGSRGKASLEDVSAGNFTDVRKALEWSLEAPEYRHSFTIPLPGASLSGYLVGDTPGFGEVLTLATQERVGMSPRAIYGHHAVLTDYSGFFDVIVTLDPDMTPLFDRGVAWIRLQKDGSAPSLDFCVNPGAHSMEELADGITRILKRVNVVLNDLLNGMMDNPKT